MTNPSETKLVERLREAQWDEAKHRPAFNRAIADGAPVEVLEQVEEVAKLCAEAATALASLADELRLEREDARRYRWLQDWYLREGKRSEIDEFGHIRQTTALIMDASIDAAASGPKEG